MARAHKYGAKSFEVDGRRFDSKREAKVYHDLKIRQRAGEISDLMVQPEFPFVIDGEPVRGLRKANGRKGAPIKYVADFAFREDGKRRVVDVKGMDTPMSRLKRAIAQHIHGIEVEVWK